VLFGHREAGAAAEVHRFNLVISGIPTSVTAADYNDRLDFFNQRLDAQGLEGLKEIKAAFLFDTQLRYFVRPNIAVEMGIGQLRQQSKREYLPTLNANIQFRAEVLSAPVHVGAAYYLQPYNVGDFRAQAYLGGGFLSAIYNRARLEGVASGLDSLTMQAANFKVTGQGDAPGYYLDAGVHMFFALRFSVMISALYRSQVVRDLRGTVRFADGSEVDVERMADIPVLVPLGGMEEFDLSGIGARLAVAIGF
jgi:hypothetical protein